MTKENRAFVAVAVVPNEEGTRMRLTKALQGLCAVVVLVVALTMLVAAPALATYTHVFSSSFGEAGSSDGQMELRGEIFLPPSRGGSGVAVNSSTHDVYVADTGNHRVDEFSASGGFVRAWGWGVADGTTEALQTCTSGCHAGIAGMGAGQLNEPNFIAVDNSGGPSEGDVYVADRAGSSTFVVKFTASGNYLSTNDGSGALFPISGPFGDQAIAGIATDTSGDLWVYSSSAIVFEFAQDGSFVTDSPPLGSGRPLGIAIDSTRSFYFDGIKFTPSGDLIGTISLSATAGVAVNLASDDLYIDERGEQIARYTPSCDPSGGTFCTASETFAAGGELHGAEALAVDSSDDSVYVSNIGADQIAVFGRTPDVTTGQPPARTPTTAMLSGTVNPDNTSVSDCHFDYVTDAEYHAGEADPYAAGGSLPCDTLPSGSGPVAVHAEIAGLTPETVYHFRLQATNAYGTSFGGDETVPGTSPAVDSTSAAEVTSATAELRAAINPGGGDTTYHFEYGTSISYGASAPAPDADIGSGAGDVQVNRRVQGLLAGAVYHYRVVARNMLGTTLGPDRTFTTQPSSGTGTDACPNAGIRGQQNAASLPDCRAYEQVSPPDKNGSPILGVGDNEHYWRASPDGSAFTYTSSGIFADAQASAALFFPYLAARGQDGWSSRNLLPSQAPDSFLPFPEITIFSQDLTKGLLIDGGGSGSYGQDQPALVPGEPHHINLFLRDNSTNSYQLINLTPPSATPAPVQTSSYAGSSDLSHVVFLENSRLTADSPPAGEHPNLYEWSAGAVRLVGILPDGNPVSGSLDASLPITYAANVSSHSRILDDHAVSDDGSRVFFEVFEATGDERHGQIGLYLRQNAATTVQIDASRGPGSGGGGEFVFASSDGSQAFFLDDGSGNSPGTRFLAAETTSTAMTPTAGP